MHSESTKTVEAIGRRVRSAREAAGLRQDQLAFAAGVSTRLVHGIETGKATLRLDGLLKVLQALGLTLQIVDRPLRLEIEPTDAAEDADGD